MPSAFARIATTSGSDFSCPCIVGYGSSPSRRGPDNPRVARSDTRSLRFRPVPFVRDGVFDHDGASAPRIATPHMLPSTVETVSASVMLNFSRLNISRVRDLRGIWVSCGEAEGLHSVGVLSFGDEF